MGFRILMVIDHYPPILGGAQLQTQRLSKQLVQRGHEVGVAALWQMGLQRQEDDDGVSVTRIRGWTTSIPWFFKDPGWRRYPPPLPDPGLVLGLRQLIGRFQPDVVQVYGWIAYSCVVALLGKKIPLIVSLRDYGHSCANRLLMRHDQICDGPALMKCLECATHYYGVPKALAAIVGIRSLRDLLVHKTNVFHSVSTFVKNIMWRDLFRVRDDAHLARTGTVRDIVIHDLFDDNDEGAPGQDYIDRLPSKPFMLFVGTLAHHKGLGVLLAAYKQLASPPPLVLIGIAVPDTPGSFPPGVTTLCDIPHPAVMAAWERCLFGLVPSLCPDCFPNVVLEGMSKGKAVIGTNVGGIPDMLVDNETGLLVPLGDANALANTMRRLIEDVELRGRLGNAARQRVKLFASDTIVPRFEELYRQLAGNAREK